MSRWRASSLMVVLAALCVCGAIGASSEAEAITRGDAAYAERFIPEQMAKAIAAYEAALAAFDTLSIQSQSHVLNRLAQLHYESTTFTFSDTPEDREAFEAGRAYGLRSLRLNAEFAAMEPDGFAAAVAVVTDPAALLWTADNWGGLFGFEPLTGMLHLGKVRALYERCLALDETFWGASTHNALGAMLVVTPTALGGDPGAGLAHLERAVDLAPDYLINRVVRAQYRGFTYDVFGNISGVRDAGFIEEHLQSVLDAPIGAWPFWNREAKREAETLLERLSELPS